MSIVKFLPVVVAVCCSISFAEAGSVIDGVKERGVVRCGSVERPGLAYPDGGGRWAGLNVDFCRAVAAAVLGSPDRIQYGAYGAPRDFDRVRNQQDDVFFLTGSEINEQNLAGKVSPGPVIFVESHAVMVPSESMAKHVADLAGDSICYLIGSSSERSLASYFDSIHKDFVHRAFSEEGEMVDTYSVQNCHAIAGETTTLATIPNGPGVNKLSSRLLPELPAVFPVLAMTGTGDAQWFSIVAWTVHTVISAERPQTRRYAGGAGSMPVSAPELGLEKDWQSRVLKAVGNYGDIFERNIGRNSPLKLDRGLNANQLDGGLLLSPFLE